MAEVEDRTRSLAWLQHIWLASLIFAFFPLIFSPDTEPETWVATFVLVGIFLALHVWGERAEGRATRPERGWL